MELTIDGILGHAGFVKAVADRALANELDEIALHRYLDFNHTPARSFKSLYGTTTAVRMGSVIDRNSGKSLRGDSPMGEAIICVADMGDRFNLNNDHLASIKTLIDRVNAGKSSADEIVKKTTKYFRELSIAPYKRMDKVLFDLMSYGRAEVKIKDNPKGVSILDMEIPIIKAEAKSSDKDHLVEFLLSLLEKYRHLKFGTMEMNQSTFIKYFAKNKEITGTYKLSLGGAEVSTSGIVPFDAVNAIVTSLGLPAIRIVKEVVTDLNGDTSPVLPDDRILFLPKGKIGELRYATPYELEDRVPNKTYVVLNGDHMITTERTNEGRILEYECSWIPEIQLPKHILSVDLKAIK